MVCVSCLPLRGLLRRQRAPPPADLPLRSRSSSGARRAAPPPPLKDGEQEIAVYVISDLHTDHAANLRWVEQLQAPPPRRGRLNVLLLAGDVSHDLRLLRRTLELLVERYDRVVFVIGNHDVWVS